jgi:hypothetical protein
MMTMAYLEMSAAAQPFTHYCSKAGGQRLGPQPYILEPGLSASPGSQAKSNGAPHYRIEVLLVNDRKAVIAERYPSI